MSTELRAPRDPDAAAVAHFATEHWPEPMTEEGVRQWWSAPTLDRDLDARIDGNGYGQVNDFGDGRIWIDLRGRPSAELVDWAEQRAREKGTRLLSGSWAANERVLDELERRGYRPIRYSQRMVADLAEAAAESVWPEGVQVRTFEDGDERAFYDATQETFADTWEPIDETFEEWSHFLLDPAWFDPELWFLATAGDETAGFAICKAHRGDPALGWIQLLGVRSAWRGRGVGRALLVHVFRVFQERGLARAGLGVDADSPTGAHRLYESVGMRAAARFVICEKFEP